MPTNPESQRHPSPSELFLQELIRQVDISALAEELLPTFSTLISEHYYTKDQVNYITGILKTLDEYQSSYTREVWRGIIRFIGGWSSVAEIETIGYDQAFADPTLSVRGVLIGVRAPTLIDRDPETKEQRINSYSLSFPISGPQSFCARIAVDTHTSAAPADSLSAVYEDTADSDRILNLVVAENPFDLNRFHVTYYYASPGEYYVPDSIEYRDQEEWLVVEQEDRRILVAIPEPPVAQ